MIAAPDPGQALVGWTVGDVAGNPISFLTNNPITVAMVTNRTVIAQFTARPWIEIVRCQGELVKGLFQFKVHGRLLDTFVIETSPTLDNPSAWHEVGRATNVLGAVQYADPYLLNVPQRFYRARLD